MTWVACHNGARGCGVRGSSGQAAVVARFRVAREWAGTALVVGVVAVLAGCASVNGAADVPSGHVGDHFGWGNSQVDVSDVLPGDDPGTLLLRTEATRAPECTDEPTVDVTVDGARIFVTVSAMHSADAKVAGVNCAIDPTVRDLPLQVGVLQSDTILIVNGETWESNGAGGVARCDRYLGCGEPPADPCDGYLARFIMDLDVPQHTSQGVWWCDGTWMAYVVDPATSYCGPSDGESTCDVPSQQRIAILKFDPDVPSWVTVTWLKPPVTCTDIVASVPEMTQATCLALLPGQ